MEGRPSKKDFANLINSVLGQDVMTEKKLDRILYDAKRAKETRGTEGLFNYLRQITNAPVSNEQIKSIADMVKNSGGPDKALEALKNQKIINETQASQIDKTLNKGSKVTKKRRKRR
ncbi:hypothetical protein [Numidum massiliense]|uniref:hypothetical protein n=1 Tax=Numidum massiliense TaxID=1522315 RepID=UPI0006D54518|nr:hypothetical protein [Numidum massiliense]